MPLKQAIKMRVFLNYAKYSLTEKPKEKKK
jgi:hypothetical protein